MIAVLLKKMIFKEAQFGQISYGTSATDRHSKMNSSNVLIYVYSGREEIEQILSKAQEDSGGFVGSNAFDDDFYTLHYVGNNCIVDVTMACGGEAGANLAPQVNGVPNFGMPRDYARLVLEIMRLLNCPGVHRSKGVFKYLCRLFLRALLVYSSQRAKIGLFASLRRYFAHAPTPRPRRRSDFNNTSEYV